MDCMVQTIVLPVLVKFGNNQINICNLTKFYQTYCLMNCTLELAL